MQPIVAALDSVFAASSADKFYDDLYGDGAPAPSASPTGKGRPDSGMWEDIPDETSIWENHKYHVTPQDHRMLHDWVGPSGERVIYHPERLNTDLMLRNHAQYHVVHKMPDGSVKKHIIHPSLSANNKWWHTYTHYADPEAMQDDDLGSVIEEHHNTPAAGPGSVGEILSNISRLNSGETSRDVWPEHYQDEA